MNLFSSNEETTNFIQPHSELAGDELKVEFGWSITLSVLIMVTLAVKIEKEQLK